MSTLLPPEVRGRRFHVPGPWDRSLQARLVAYFLLLSGLTVVVVGLVVYQRATRDLTESAFERLQAVADLKADALDRWLEEQRRNTVFVAAIPGMREAATGLLAPGTSAAERALARSWVDRTLQAAVRETAGTSEYQLLDDDGVVRYSTDPGSEGMSHADQAFFLDGRTTTTVQEVYESPKSGEATTTVATPILGSDRRGARVAVLAANYDLERMDAIVLERTGLGPGGATYLVDADGRIIHAELDRGEAVDSLGIREALAGNDGEATYQDHDGVPVIGAYRWLDRHDLALIVEQAEAEAFAPARELAVLIGLVGLVSALLLASGVWIIARRVTRPLRTLADAAGDVAHGDLATRVPVTSADEVGRLTAGFNDMTAQLRENVETLERRVAERTAELSSALEGQKEAELQYRQLVEELPMAVYTETPGDDDPSFYISSRVERLLGYPVARWAEPGFKAEIMYPDDRERALGELAPERADAHGRTAATYRVFASDGATVWISEQRWIVRDLFGSPTHVQGLITDVTERTLEQAELRRQKTYFESLVEASPVAVITTVGDQDLVVAWNPGATRLFGWDPAEALGRTIDDLVLNDESLKEDGLSVTREASETGRASRITRRTRKDGSFVDVEILVVPLVVDGQEIASLAIYHDISELVEARQEADAANQAKSAFLAAMSHEIRTPMNAIIGMSGLLADSELSPEQRDFVETIQTSGDALLTIINDILDFSKIEAGRVELDAEPFSLRACLEGAIDVLAPSAAEKGIELAYDIDAEVPAGFIGDEGRLRQVVLNLLSNAVKFTEVGEVELHAGGVPVDGPDGPWRLVVTVRDTGIGIPPDRMARLFQSFSQADASISRRFGGTGLGLAISRRLAELMGGSIDVESSGVEGEGSTFTLTARLRPAAAVVDGRAAAVAAELAERSVIIVDDNDTNRRILSAQVGRWGMSTRDTASPAEALDWVRGGETVDLVLSDLHMPELDGLDLAAEIHAARPSVPVVILSSLGHRDKDQADVAAYLTKPVKPSALHDAIQEALSGGSGSVAARTSGPTALDPAMASRHPLRILLAEDNPVNQKLAVKLLERMGYVAEVVADGASAVAAVAAETFDVVLMDVQMPQLDGLEATRRIIAEQGGSRPRIVAMTANAMDEDRDACLAAGMDDYISKPIRPEVLIEALRQVPSSGGSGA